MDSAPAHPADGSKLVPSTAIRKQPALKRSSGGAAKPAGTRKNSGAEYGKGQTTVTFRRSVSQTDFTGDFHDGITGLQRPSKPVQVPMQLPLQLPADQPSVLQFAEDVRYRLTNTMHPHAPKVPPPANTRPQKKGSMMRTSKSDSDLETYLLINQSASSDTSSISHKSYEDTPFELKALEAVLDTVCAKLSGMTDELWRAGDPVLRSPTVHTVTTLLLDKMRRIKNRMVRLKTRVETIRELLEKFLEDEGDMKSMNLTARKQRVAATTADSVDAGDKGSYLEQAPSLRLALGRLSLERKSMRAPGHDEDDADMHQVEMLLQAYFIQMDNTFNRLGTMNEYISDTEEYIDLEIDNFRNNLIRTRMILNAGNLALATVFAVVSVWGMNLNNKDEDQYALFVVVTVVSCFGAMLFFGVLMGWCIWYKIVNNPFTVCFEGRRITK